MTLHGHGAIETAQRLVDLVATLHQTYGDIRALVGDQADAVVHSPSATTYLFPETQFELGHLERVERRFAAERSSILDALPAHIAIVDTTGTIVSENKAWRKFHGDHTGSWAIFDGADTSILQAVETSAPDDAEKFATGLRDVLSGARPHFTMEYARDAPDSRRWFLLDIVALTAGTLNGAIVMHVDISERYRAHEREQNLQRRLEVLIDHNKVGILVHRYFRPILANKELARIFGFESSAEIMALEDGLQLFPENERERLSAFNAARLVGETAPQVVMVQGIRRDGRAVTIESRSFSLMWEGGPAVCAMLTDVTDRIEMEEKLRSAQRLEAIGQLTGGIAHDFNNLLTVILGNSELLAEQLSDNPRLQALAEVTAETAVRGADLTRRLLTFARRGPLVQRLTDMNQSIAGMDGLLRRALGQHIEVVISLADDIWPILIDPSELENAVLNLCINARDAMSGGGRLTIRTENIVAEGTLFDQGDVVSECYAMVSVSVNRLRKLTPYRRSILTPLG